MFFFFRFVILKQKLYFAQMKLKKKIIINIKQTRKQIENYLLLFKEQQIKILIKSHTPTPTHTPDNTQHTFLMTLK